MSFHFFLSHARIDRDYDPDRLLIKLYKDLDGEIRRKKSMREAVAGFFDEFGIQQGTNWNHKLVEALRTCRVLLCVYSKAYFDSDYCGREWAIFNARVDEHVNNQAAGADRPPVILPIMLDPPQDWQPLPPLVHAAKIQYVDGDYPEEYREEGLLYLMRRKSQEENYISFRDTLVQKIIATAEQYALQSLAVPPDITTVESAFRRQNLPQPLAATVTAHAGPRYTDFFYVAGKSAEIMPLGRSIANYGDEGADWKPYWPEVKEDVALLAQAIAGQEGFRSNHVVLNDDWIHQISESQNKSRIVVIIVDTWTLCLEEYRRLMQMYDTVNFWNCAALIAWNKNDQDTITHQSLLQKALRQAFLNKALIKNSVAFIDNIGSPDDFKSNLSIALQKVKAQIIEISDLRKIDNIQGSSIPTIAGPGRA